MAASDTANLLEKLIRPLEKLKLAGVRYAPTTTRNRFGLALRGSDPRHGRPLRDSRQTEPRADANARTGAKIVDAEPLHTSMIARLRAG